MKYVIWLVSILAVVFLGISMFARLATMDPGVWHVDPFAAERSGKPNDYLVGPKGDQEALILAMPPSDALARFDAAAMADDRVTRLAGSVDDAWVTYVQRSALMGYPDAISVRATPEGDGSRLAVWSRSRMGYSDLGVNAARVTRWLDASGLRGD